MQYQRLRKYTTPIEPSALGPWDQNQTTLFSHNRLTSSLSLSPKKQLRQIKQSIPISLKKSNFKIKSNKPLYPLNHLYSMDHLQLKKLDTIISYKSSSIEYEPNSYDKNKQSFLRYQSQESKKQPFRRFRISTKYGRQWFNLSKLPKNESLIVSSQGWKKLKTLDYSDITSHNFVAKRKLVS